MGRATSPWYPCGVLVRGATNFEDVANLQRLKSLVNSNNDTAKAVDLDPQVNVRGLKRELEIVRLYEPVFSVLFSWIDL